MNSEVKRLAVIATIFFLPTALVGWALHKKSPEQAIKLFRLSIYLFAICLCLLGAYAVIMGGRVLEALGTFF